jgi:hypothetical protein
MSAKFDEDNFQLEKTSPYLERIIELVRDAVTRAKKPAARRSDIQRSIKKQTGETVDYSYINTALERLAGYGEIAISQDDLGRDLIEKKLSQEEQQIREAGERGEALMRARAAGQKSLTKQQLNARDLKHPFRRPISPRSKFYSFPKREAENQ